MDTVVMTLPDSIGVLGVFLILIAYLLLQTERISSQQMVFPLLNLIGALLHLYSLIYAWNIASFCIELFWVAISLYGVLKIARERRLKRTNG